MFQYEIAELVLQVHSDSLTAVGIMNDYLINQHRKPDLNINLKSADLINVPEGRLICEESIKWLHKPDEAKGYYLYTTEKNYDKVLTLADIDSEWRNAKIHYLDNSYLHTLIGIMFRYYLINHGGIVIHSSSLECRGRGIMFSAPSGTGKSTHVRLWKKYLGEGVRILNDDTPAVRPVNGKMHVFGTPWSGSAQIHCNGRAPLEAIVLLEQAVSNQVHQLTVQEAIPKLLPRTFLPYFDKNMMDRAFNIVGNVLSRVPVYLLKCRPDKESVELIYECVMS